jgi:hypothetical protein
MDAKAQLQLIGGGHINVMQLPQDAARLLWGRKDGDDAHDMGYAALQTPDGKTVNINPGAVASVTDPPPNRSRTVSFGD